MRALTSAALAALAAALPPAQAQVSEAETDSFYAFYRSLHPDAHLPNPAFSTGPRGGKRQLSATVDGPGQRAVLPLCRAPRETFDYSPQGRPSQRWRLRGDAEQVMWIHHAGQCGTPPEHAVRLLAAVADMDALRLLQQYPELLGSARLLMAGNTRCAPLRNHGFRLTGLDRAKDGQNVLVFESSQGGTARIATRKLHNEFVAWGAECEAPRPNQPKGR
ncbi:hypothetical protein [Massilia endophytica]|uniref:hypothetical protein n=1 Tax=Massilia endophytica TaxID=2899220 RepID=UPI001E51D177|nr:hypothetical protein [Massilia endophytica]UGQ47091.1 hypothetical protein LSQ66_01020 [Massilia endophytica]